MHKKECPCAFATSASSSGEEAPRRNEKCDRVCNDPNDIEGVLLNSVVSCKCSCHALYASIVDAREHPAFGAVVNFHYAIRGYKQHVLSCLFFIRPPLRAVRPCLQHLLHLIHSTPPANGKWYVFAALHVNRFEEDFHNGPGVLLLRANRHRE